MDTTKKRTPSRHAERVRAFQFLYGLTLVPVETEAALADAFTDAPHPKNTGPVGGEARGFAWELAQGVWKNRDELDETITRFSQHWKIGRIAKIELTVLRLALYEMCWRADIPLKVAINEGVELAKQFGDDNSPGFINGILDAAARAFEKGELKAKYDKER